MYEQAFNLNARPFTSMHYVKHYYAARAINETLETCQLTIGRGSGPVVVIGDHGTGKTLLLALLEEKFRQHLRVISLSADTIRSREDFLQNMLYQLQLNHRGLGENEMRLDIIDSLKSGQVGSVLLLIDNAQKMTIDAFEEIQPLLDFVYEGQPQVRLLLAGSQGVEDRLADNRLVTFNQRIASRCFLSNLNSEETEAYVRAHLVRVGGDPDALFAPESWRAIYEVTEGRPRFINQVCDHAMIFSATRGVVPITDSLVREAWFDIQRLPGSVAPAGSGASISEQPVVTERIISGDEGDEEWTVLEFGELAGESQTAEPSTEEAAPAEANREVAADEQTQQEPAAPVEEEVVTPFAVEQQEDGLERGNAAIIASAIAGIGLAGAGGVAMASDSPETELPETPETTAQNGGSAEPAEPAERVDSAAPIAGSTDPFDRYEFENEEVLTDAYSPFVAEQNQRSLEVTSEQLENLTPADELSEPTADPIASVEGIASPSESFPTFETAMVTEPVREPAIPNPIVQPHEAQMTRGEFEPAGAQTGSEEFSVQQAAPAEVESFEPELQTGSGYVPIAPGPPGDAAAIAASPETQEDDIRRQAEEIIQSLNARESEDAGQGITPAAAVRNETNVIEKTIDQAIVQSTQGTAEQPQVVMPFQESPQAASFEPKAFQQPTLPTSGTEELIPDPVEPERRILEDLREQSAIASESIAPPALAEMPEDGIAQAAAQPQDDRDILQVSAPQYAAPEAASAEDLPAWTEQEPSSGEASRVDYQKLFNQLRNHQNQEES